MVEGEKEDGVKSEQALVFHCGGPVIVVVVASRRLYITISWPRVVDKIAEAASVVYVDAHIHSFIHSFIQVSMSWMALTRRFVLPTEPCDVVHRTNSEEISVRHDIQEQLTWC